jgi:hypothetical protein
MLLDGAPGVLSSASRATRSPPFDYGVVFFVSFSLLLSAV